VGAAKDRAVYQFKVSLAHISPPIWRRIQVWEDSTLHQLHRVLQAVMGWENYHLYEFVISAKKYRDPHPENERKIRDARRTRLPMILPRVGAAIEYVYDFGDGWRHELLLEAIVLPDRGVIYPRCIAGERSGPPEDSGGPWGYADYLQAMADPSHERYDEMMGWRGPFDPEAFSMEKVNLELEKEFRTARKRTSPGRVSGKPKPPAEILDEAVQLEGGAHTGKGRTWVDKKTKKGFRGYPAAMIAFYGPTADVATKIVVAIVRDEGCEPDPLERWFSKDIDVRCNPAVGEKVLAFLKEHAVKSVIATDGLIGCPHEEGIDYPAGKSCPQCPYWAGRDRFTRERIQ